MMRQVLKWAALVLSGTGILAVARVCVLLVQPAPHWRVLTLSWAIQRATLHVSEDDRTPPGLCACTAIRGAPPVIVLHGSFMDGEMMRKWTGYEFGPVGGQEGLRGGLSGRLQAQLERLAMGDATASPPSWRTSTTWASSTP